MARGPVLPVFIWSPGEEEPHSLGAASRWWLDRSLAALNAELDGLRSRLVLRAGTSASELLDIVKATGAKAVYCERTFDP